MLKNHITLKTARCIACDRTRLVVNMEDGVCLRCQWEEEEGMEIQSQGEGTERNDLAAILGVVFLIVIGWIGIFWFFSWLK